jgi:hypothetical protein
MSESPSRLLPPRRRSHRGYTGVIQGYTGNVRIPSPEPSPHTPSCDDLDPPIAVVVEGPSGRHRRRRRRGGPFRTPSPSWSPLPSPSWSLPRDAVVESPGRRREGPPTASHRRRVTISALPRTPSPSWSPHRTPSRGGEGAQIDSI